VRARSSVDDLQGGTFSITNAGNIGGLFATPIINFPEVAILGVHAIKKTPVVGENGEIRVGDVMYLSVSIDHRIVDGAMGARWMNVIKALPRRPAAPADRLLSRGWQPSPRIRARPPFLHPARRGP
jgi:pyruvate/2-oxoglutarate dehydrogenase complex dihydrolipoamide acyltransferase (E2) component